MLSSFNYLNAQIELKLENKIADPNKTNELHPAIMNSAIYRTSGSQFQIFGEVFNNLSQPITFVQVYAAVYDNGGNVVATDYAYTSDTYLKPGQKSGFWILIENDIPENSKYALTSTFEKTSEVKPDLLKLDTGFMSKDPVEIVGTVTNLATETATSVSVTGIFYDENHTVVDTNTDYVNIGYGIPAGEKANFSVEPVLNYENHYKIKSVALNVDSLEYSMVSNTPNSTVTRK